MQFQWHHSCRLWYNDRRTLCRALIPFLSPEEMLTGCCSTSLYCFRHTRSHCESCARNTTVSSGKRLRALWQVSEATLGKPRRSTIQTLLSRKRCVSSQLALPSETPHLRCKSAVKCTMRPPYSLASQALHPIQRQVVPDQGSLFRNRHIRHTLRRFRLPWG